MSKDEEKGSSLVGRVQKRTSISSLAMIVPPRLSPIVVCHDAITSEASQAGEPSLGRGEMEKPSSMDSGGGY